VNAAVPGLSRRLDVVVLVDEIVADVAREVLVTEQSYPADVRDDRAASADVLHLRELHRALAKLLAD